MDGETLLLTLIALREQAQSEEEYDAAVAMLTGESAAMSIDSIEPIPLRTRPAQRRPSESRGLLNKSYHKRHLQGRSIFLAREEAFGSEPPGPDWTSAGEGRWVKADAPAPAKRSRDALRIAVVGGGPGGLFTTYLLNQRVTSAEVTIFEASERLGGKILTKEFGDGTRYEAGVAELYEYLGPGDKDPLRQLIEKELDLSTREMTGGAVILKEEILHDLDAVESVHGKPTRKKIERFHRTCADLMPLEKYTNRWQPEPDHPWANDTFLAHILREMEGDQVATDYVLAAVHSDLATAPHTCNGLNGLKNVLMDNDAYMRLYHVEGGIGRLAEALEGSIQAIAHMNSPVVEVVKRKEKYRVHYQAAGREAHEDFEAVVLALPNHWLSQLRWEQPSLRSSMQRLLARYDLPAHYLRVSLLFVSRWWDHLHIDGDYWMIDSCGGIAVYDESARWRADEDDGHVLSFLIAGEAALLLCSNNQSDEEIVQHLLRSLPACMAEAQENLIEYSVNRWAGSINAQPGGWLPRELRGQHTPDKKDHPGLVICADFLFDSTLNAALMSASTAVELLIEHLGVTAEKGAPAAKQLEPKGGGL